MSINTAQPARTTDLLTGLGNYQTFTDAIEAQMAQAAEDSVNFSLAVVDLGYFKQFTDEHGHQAGDRALQILADHLSASMAEGDLVFRYGGEEFIIIFPGTEKEQAFLRLEMARQAFDQPHEINDTLTLPFTFSTGLSALSGRRQPSSGGHPKSGRCNVPGEKYRPQQGLPGQRRKNDDQNQPLHPGTIGTFKQRPNASARR